jgi:predicted DNA-binding transcriptional regulator AlpA
MQHRVLRTNPAADYCGLAPSTLEKKRVDGTGPRYVKLGPRAVGIRSKTLTRTLTLADVPARRTRGQLRTQAPAPLRAPPRPLG